MVKIIITSFSSALLSLFFAVYAIFSKNEAVFIVNVLLFYFSLLLFLWFVSLPIDVETAELRAIRIFSFILAVAMISVFLLIVGFLLVHFYFK